MKKKMNEKGVSTLIETVLIIGFTIVLAAVVMTWGGSFVRTLTEKQSASTQTATECIGIRFDISDAVYGKSCITSDGCSTPATDTCTDNVCKTSTGVLETDNTNHLVFKTTSNVDQKIKSFVVLLQHEDGTTDSLSADGKSYPDASTAPYCEVGGFSTVICQIDTLSKTPVDGDKIELIPMVEATDASAQACTIDSASSRVINVPPTPA